MSDACGGVIASRDDQGSTIPLILGFFLIALTMIAAGVAAGDAFVQQRGLQDVCDGAAAEAASTAVDLTRGHGIGTSGALNFVDVQQRASEYVARDRSRSAVSITARLSGDATTLTLTCTETTHIAFGALFGKGNGVHHLAESSARAPVS